MAKTKLKTASELQRDSKVLYPTGDSLPKVEKNRAYKTTLKNDSYKDIHIGFEDIDKAIFYYFNNTIKPTYFQNNEQHPVPVIYGSPEKWKIIQKDGYLREKDGKIQKPLIVIKRSSITKNKKLGNKLDGNNVNLYQYFEKKYSLRNRYDRFSLINNIIPQKEIYATIVPDYVTINYSGIIFTNYVEQVNKIIEVINYASDSYWGDERRFRFNTTIDSFSDSVELSSTDDRVVKSTFNLTLNGYIIPESVSKAQSVQSAKFYSKSQIVFNLETEVDFNNPTAIPRTQNNTGTSIIENNMPNNFTIEYSADLQNALNYLNSTKAKPAISVITNGATFTATISTPPANSNFPAQTKSDFVFYINGQSIPDAYVISFTQSGLNCTVVFDTSSLGWELLSTFQVTVIGKFD